MSQLQQLTDMEREGGGYNALCPEPDIASQGNPVEEARSRLLEAVEWFFETADPSEIQRRVPSEVVVTRLGDQ
jgi:predicted RNase H-like HicB family nuclease